MCESNQPGTYAPKKRGAGDLLDCCLLNLQTGAGCSLANTELVGGDLSPAAGGEGGDVGRWQNGGFCGGKCGCGYIYIYMIWV